MREREGRREGGREGRSDGLRDGGREGWRYGVMCRQARTQRLPFRPTDAC